MNARILIVDPDSESLEAYRGALAAKNASWELITARTASEAYDAASERAPDISVVAHKLEQNNGLSVLSQIVDRAPLTHPFIVASEDEKDQLAHAFEGGCRFLPSDCPADQLILEFRRCLAIENWYENPTIKELFADQTRYRLLKPHYLEALKALNANKPSNAKIAEAIGKDPALAAKALEIANAFSQQGDKEVSSIAQAVPYLGIEATRHSLLLTQLFLKVTESEETQALATEIWHHSLSVATAAKRISLFENEDGALAETAFSAGLLHDIGKLVLLDSDHEGFVEAQRQARDNALPAWQAEQQQLGCDHAEVGAYLLHRWGLPDEICESTALHHRPANSCSESFSSLAATHAANAIVRKRRNSSHPDAQPTQAFLEEIGKADRWDDWEAVVAGQEPPSKAKARLKLSRTPEPKAPEPARQAPAATENTIDRTTRAAHAELSHAINKATEDRERKARYAELLTRKSTLHAFLAGAILSVIGIHFLNSIGEDDENFPIQEAAASDKKQNKENYLAARHALMNDLLKEERTPSKPSQSDPRQESASDPTALTNAHAEAEKTEPPPPPPPPPPPFPEIKLGAIFMRSSGAKAQVNGKILGVGDRIEEAMIKEILRTSIVVEHYGREKTLHLD